jgi:hypothetical protein
MRRPGASAGAIALALAVLAPPLHAVEQLTPVLASLIADPIPVRQTDGRWQVVYELELTNVTDVPMSIESVDVSAAAHGDTPIASLSGDALAAHLSLPGGQHSTTLGSAQAGLLFVNLSFDRRDAIPTALMHRIVATTPEAKGPLPARSVEEVAPTRVVAAPPIVLGPPLRGHRWVAAASCCESYHRRAALPIDGRRRLAQRFAIDWMQLDAQQRMATGDPARLESYPQYGAEALAVAAARVAHVTDGLPEQPPGSFPSAVTIASADGNSVILDLGGGRFALYAHLQPGSIRVREGQRVTRGQVLGLVGSSGNSDAPHLHFHVMDGPSALASNGLPYVIDRIDVVGHAVSADDLETELKTAEQPVEVVAEPAPARHTNQLPADLAVVDFVD